LVLQPRILRKGAIFADLSNHSFTVEEKIFLTAEMEYKNISWDFQVSSIRAISRRYKIPSDGLRLILTLKKYNIPLYPGKLTYKSSDLIDRKGIRNLAVYRASAQHREHLMDKRVIDQEIEATIQRKRQKSLATFGRS
jgi:hypothetical protein